MNNKPKKRGKLVRNGIPDIIRADGGNPEIEVLSDNATYIKALLAKLNEELRELFRASGKEKVVEESGDVLQVIKDIFIARGILFEEANFACTKKHFERGGFDKRFFLVSPKK